MANLFSISIVITTERPTNVATLQTLITNTINIEVIRSLFVPTIDKHITDLQKIVDTINTSISSKLNDV